MAGPLLGVGLCDWGVEVRRAIRLAVEAGFGAVELDATQRGVTPGELSNSGRRQLARLVTSTGMRFASLEVNVAGGVFTDFPNLDERIHTVRSIIELAHHLAVPVVTFEPGETSDGDGVPDALGELCELADRTGVTLALQLGHTFPETLCAWIAQLQCPALGACIDPATLTARALEPERVVGALADHIGLIHLRDATFGGKSSAERETPLGDGHVDFMSFVIAADAAGYTGPFILRRRDSRTGTAEAVRARRYLESLTGFGGHA